MAQKLTERIKQELGRNVRVEGLPVAEAMACGTPTIMTIHGGLWRAVTFGQRHSGVQVLFVIGAIGALHFEVRKQPVDLFLKRNLGHVA